MAILTIMLISDNENLYFDFKNMLRDYDELDLITSYEEFVQKLKGRIVDIVLFDENFSNNKQNKNIKEILKYQNRIGVFAIVGNKINDKNSSNISKGYERFSIGTLYSSQMEILNQIQKTLKNHKRIIFSGNGYSDEWKKEAQKRGLLELKTTADALPHYTDPKNLQLFEKHNVYSASELHARESILLTNYYQVVQIEAKTMAYMLRKQILPAIFSYEAKLAQIIQTKKSSGIEAPLEVKILKNINTPLELVSNHLDTLESLINKETTTEKQAARFAADELLPLMETIRQLTDVIETNVSKEDWPLPDYNDILFKSML